MKKLVIGILAHVDAGKTTLSESLLFHCGQIRKPGRVDHGDSFLDNFSLERERGITIFSKQAQLKTDDLELTLLDTPGHVDFSAEMERTLQVLDYAILVVSGMDGVQGHTLTLWRLLKRYQVPVFVFINKMDQNGTDAEALMADLKKNLHVNCVDFGSSQDPDIFLENVAVCDEQLLESYLENGMLTDEDIQLQIRERNLFPCFFGSALRDEGVSALLEGIRLYTRAPEFPDTFAAKVYKIARDEQGNRLTYLKVTGGSLKVKSIVSGRDRGRSDEAEYWEEKADQIRIYSGAKYESVQEAEAGRICAVTGLTRTYPGEGLGAQADSELPMLEPVLNYQVQLPLGCDVHQMLQKLRQLEEEEPQLHILWDEKASEIHAQLMGEVQTEILKRLIWDRFQVAVEFGEGKIVYKETITAPVEGIGHFEPLRHYAEVHLLLEPGEPGSGLQFFTACSEDVLDRNWQRLILTHLEEREHPGVLTGSPITDMQITLITGKAHLKHTEGGDFRQATYRAVRQGLRKADCILLEPYYEFRLEVPGEMVGRAMNDIQQMGGSFQTPELEGDAAVLTGTAPVSSMRNYQKEVIDYSHGKGRLFCSLSGYAPCGNQEAAVAMAGYDPDHDPDNPTGSVFCAHGAGFLVPWDQVDAYAHLETISGLQPGVSDGMADPDTEAYGALKERKSGNSTSSYEGTYADEKELQAIFERTFGPVKRDRGLESSRKVVHAPADAGYRPAKRSQKRDEYLLVDGYNVIFSWEELRELSQTSIDAARDRLIDILSDYQGYRKCTLIVVFDAYKQEGHVEEILKYPNIYVVYTREAETADQYIEKTVHRIGRQNDVTVATSDGLEQIIILGQGARRLPASGLKEEIEHARQEMNADWKKNQQGSRNLLIDNVPDETRSWLQRIRLGKKQLEDLN